RRSAAPASGRLSRQGGPAVAGHGLQADEDAVRKRAVGRGVDRARTHRARRHRRRRRLDVRHQPALERESRDRGRAPDRALPFVLAGGPRRPRRLRRPRPRGRRAHRRGHAVDAWALRGDAGARRRPARRAEEAGAGAGVRRGGDQALPGRVIVCGRSSGKEAPMTTPAPKDALLANLDKVVRETLAYFDGPGRATKARVDRWQARDVLMHFIYFHDATAWGIQSAGLGGPPWPV